MSNYVLSAAPKDIAIVGNLFKKSLLKFLPRTTFGPSVRAYVYTTKKPLKKYIFLAVQRGTNMKNSNFDFKYK